ncbi:MAG: SUMF1/EgtB/PvdO family nonheme iron enzyme [Rubrivivax sp.]|nr:SUMF1/EgtB/PvdO family nonheme iron enzyme [Rubrivivax sp.]
MPAGRGLRAWLCFGLLLAAGLGFNPASLAQTPARNFSVELALPGQTRPQALYRESQALVIGASKYVNGWSRLPGVPGDVQAVNKLLAAQGFNVQTVTDPDYQALDAALRNFIVEHGSKPEARLVIYFAGHGHTLTTSAGNRLGYIVPVDAPRPSDPRFRAKAYSMEAVEALARQIESRHVLFLFDSCFSGTIFRTRSGVPDSISAKTAEPVRQFITAGDENQPVPDESIFRRQLEIGLGSGEADLNRDGFITGSELGMFLEDTVTNYSRRSQTPRHGKIRDPNLDKGDFVFRNPFAALRPDDQRQIEDEAWALCRSATNAVPCDDYLSGWPQGRYRALAQTRLRALQVAQQPPAPAPQPAPAPAPVGVGSVVKDCDECPALVLLPAGSFQMGSPEGEKDRWTDGREGPVHEVRIGYRLAVGRTEVTRGEFGRFVSATGYRTAAEKGDGCFVWNGTASAKDAARNWRSPGFEQTEEHPVVCVSWNDAQEYLKWLNGRAAGKGFRLLSEAEWEYAARAGQGAKRYPWGDDLDYSTICAYANGADRKAKAEVPGAANWPVANCDDGYAYTAPAGRLRPNAFGLYDMHGNAWEWVQDVWNANYHGTPTDGSAWTSGYQARRLLRGGSWNYNPQFLRSAIRYGDAPDFRVSGTGFRIARTF